MCHSPCAFRPDPKFGRSHFHPPLLLVPVPLPHWFVSSAIYPLVDKFNIHHTVEPRYSAFKGTGLNNISNLGFHNCQYVNKYTSWDQNLYALLEELCYKRVLYSGVFLYMNWYMFFFSSFPFSPLPLPLPFFLGPGSRPDLETRQHRPRLTLLLPARCNEA